MRAEYRLRLLTLLRRLQLHNHGATHRRHFFLDGAKLQFFHLMLGASLEIEDQRKSFALAGEVFVQKRPFNGNCFPEESFDPVASHGIVATA